MLDQRELDWFVAMNRGLHDVLTTDELAARLRDNVAIDARARGARSAVARAAHARASTRARRAATTPSLRPALFGLAA